MLDLLAPLIHAVAGQFVISYRPNDNPTFDQVVRRGRTRYAELVDVRALREIIEHLKQGDIVWFGPDQDMGPKGSVFAPFFWSSSMHRNDPTAIGKDFWSRQSFSRSTPGYKGRLSPLFCPDAQQLSL